MKSKLYFLSLLLLISCACTDKNINEEIEYVHISQEEIQGYWKSDIVGFPVNINDKFEITGIGDPAPTGEANSLLYYFDIKGTQVSCYIKCIYNAYRPFTNESSDENIDKEIYTILMDNELIIHIKENYLIETNVFEYYDSYYLCSYRDETKIILIREYLGDPGYSHIAYTLNRVEQSEWSQIVTEAVTKEDSEYQEIYNKVFNNF